MAQMKRMDESSIDDFKITLDKDDFTFFMVDRGKYADYWDVIGLSWINIQERIVDLIFLHIDEEQLVWEDFVAEDEASGRFQCTLAEYRNLIHFLEYLLGKDVKETKQSFTHFLQLNDEELLCFHYPPNSLKSNRKQYYRYLNNEMEKDNEVQIIGFPSWSHQHGVDHRKSLRFVTFSPQQLEDPLFNPLFGSSGLHMLTFNGQTLEEFICLLKRYSIV